MSAGTGPMDAAAPPRRWAAPLPLAASILLHGLVLLWLFGAVQQQHRGGARSAARLRAQSVVITLGPQTPPQATQKPPPAPQPEPQPKPAAEAAPAHAAAHSAPAHSAPRAAAPNAAAPDPNQEIDDVLGSIRDNWLEPPGLNQPVHCHVHIDYQAGGIIQKINFASGCGNAVVVDSISRAIWKTQPLPLSKDNNQPGGIDIEFTP